MHVNLEQHLTVVQEVYNQGALENEASALGTFSLGSYIIITIHLWQTKTTKEQGAKICGLSFIFLYSYECQTQCSTSNSVIVDMGRSYILC